MNDQHAANSRENPVKVLWDALLLIVPMTFRWIWFSIGHRTTSRKIKSEMFWDLISDHLDKMAGNEGLKKAVTRRDEALKRHLGEGDTVLDYGCAHGTVAIANAGKVKSILGIDFSGKMIETARRKAADCGTTNADFMKATIFDERLEYGSYDTVLALGILHLVDDKDMVLVRINELLKPSGLLLSATECMAERRTTLSLLLSLLRKTGILSSMKFFTLAELKASITRAGFEIAGLEILTVNPVACFIAARKPDQSSPT